MVEKLGDFGRTTLLHLACRPINSQVFEIYDLYRVNEDGEHIGPLSGPFVSKLPFCAWKVLIQLFLDNGLDINARDENGITPLRYLVGAAGELARVQFLHSLGASLDIPDNNGETVLHTCLHNTDVPFDVMEFIVRHSASAAIDSSPKPSMKGERSIFSTASRKGNLPLCRLLIARRSRLTLRDKVMFNDDKAIIEMRHQPHAASSGNEQIDEINQMLGSLAVSQNLNPRVDELVAVYSAKSKQMIMLVDLLEPHINSSDIVGRTRLHIAVQEGNLEAVEALLSLNVALDRRDWAGFTALHYAHALAHTNIIMLLENATKGSEDEWIPDTDEEASEQISFALSEVGSICREHRSLWDKFCQCSEAGMTRRAEEWPENYIVMGADVKSTLDFRSLIEV